MGRIYDDKMIQRSKVLRNIIHPGAAQSGETKEEYISHMKEMIAKRLVKEVQKKKNMRKKY